MIKKVNFETLQNSPLIHNKFYSNHLSQNSIDFRREYFKDSKFLNYSLEIKNSKHQYFLPITIQLNRNQKFFSVHKSSQLSY